MIVANICKAVDMIVDYINENGLYDFNSLSDETQKKLTEAYGKYIGFHVNNKLNR